MKQNLLFNQASAIGKRIAMVLTMLLTIGIGTMWGATFTTTSSGGFSNGTKTIDGITVTIAKGSGDSPSWQSGHVRVYQGNTISFSSTSSIVSITMTATSSSYVKTFTASTGNFSTSGSTMSWEGSATSLTLTLPSGSAQARITQIVVTVETGCTGTKLGTPVVTATPSDRQVILSWPNVSNASSYQLKWNGGEWVAATSPVTKTGLTNGTAYTYQVKAIGNGSTYCDGDASEEASATPNVFYTVTWMNNGVEYTTTQVTGGSKPTFPDTPESCDAISTNFYGWATSPWSGKINNLSDKTIYTSAGDMPNVNANGTIFYAVFCEGGGGTELLNETFDNNLTSDGTQALSQGDVFLGDFSGETSKTYKGANGTVKFGTSSSQGYITSKSLDLSTAFTVTLDACKYSSDGGNIVVTVGSQSKTIANSTLGAAGTFNTYTLEFDAATSSSTVKIGTSSKRAYIDNVIIATEGNMSNYITSCSNKTTYSVTLHTDGGTINAGNVTDYAEGEGATLPTNVTKTGYTFAGWYDNSALTGTPVTTIGTNETGDKEFWAKWTINQYTVTLNPNYPDGQTGTFTYEEGELVDGNLVLTYDYNTASMTIEDLYTSLILDGYEFGGWYNAKGSNPGEVSGSKCTTTGTITGNKTYFAKWSKLYTITWKVNGEEYTEGTPTISVEDGNAITHLPTAPSAPSGCSEKVFVGWSDSEISEETDIKPITLFTDAASAPAIDGDKTFHAVFADEEGSQNVFKRMQTLDDLNNASKIAIINAYSSYAYILNTSLTAAAEAPEESSSKITVTEGQYWTLEKSNSYWKFKNSDNKYLTTNTIPTSSSKSGSVQLATSGNNEWVIANNTYTNNGTPVFTIYNASSKNAGLEYSNGWILYYSTDFNTSWFTLKLYIPDVSYSNYTTTCDNTKATITYDLNDGTGATCAKTTVTKGEKFVLCDQTPTKDGYTFAGWSDGTKTYTAGSQTTVSESTTFYAVWTAKTITITWDQNYTDCPEAATSTYIYDGEEIAMPAEPIRTGYKFTGWFNAATDGTQVTEVGETNKPTADVTYYAHWAQLYTVTFMASGQVYVVQEYKYLSGETLELPADPSAANYACDGYIFEGWSADEKTEEDATLPELVSTSTTIDADETYYAVWKKATTEGAGGNGYYLVEEELTDYSGDYLIVSYDNNYAMSTSGEDKIGTNTYAGFEDISEYYSNKVITSNATTDTYVFTAAKTTNGYSLYCKQNKTYLAILSTSTGTGSVLRYYDEGDYNTKLSECEWTIGVGSVSNYAHRDVEDKNGARGQYIRWNETNTRFAIYKETSVKGIHLYKKGAGASYLYTTSPSCGPTIVAKDGMWVTSANGQSVKVNVPIAVKSFTTTATIIGTSTNENFEITPLENVGNGINDVVEVIYTPTTADTKESATITLTAKDGETVVSTTTFTLNGRSLPDQFAIVVDKASEYFALPANMPSAGTYPGYSVALNAGSVTSAPKTHLYTAQAVHSTRFDENGTALRLVGNNNACLWATNAVSGTGIRNYAQLDNAKTADYEWNLYTEDGDTYRISCSIVTEEGRILRMYGANFGMYKSGAEVFYLLPVECTSTPTNIQVSPARVGATISWENAATCNLQILKEGTPVQQPISGAVSPVVVTGLEELTAYTFTLTPTDAASCKVDGAFTTTGPDIDIVEWMTDGMIIQVDKDDAVNPSVVINGEVEYNTGSGAVATELFFSKYFEAHGENKLLAIYNGTGAPIDLSGYTIKSENGTLDLSQFGQTKGQVAPNEEIILVYYDEVYSAEVCAELQEGYENWNILTEKSVFAFSGRGSIGLYKDDVLIDVIGSTFPSGELTKIGKSGKPDYCGTEDDVRLYIDEESVNDQSSFFCYNGDNIKTDEEENDYAISTNRCLLIRKNTVTSGANAVASNKADAGATCGDLSSTFTTLCSEWSGFRIGSGKSSSDEIEDATCDGLGYVGGFDYNNYYRTLETLDNSKTLNDYTRNADENTYFIEIENLAQYSCLNIQLQLTDNEGNVLTEQTSQVPILVTGEKSTTDPIFSAIVKDSETSNPDYETSKIRCSTCDVVILKDATLTKAAEDTENDVNQVRDIYIYPGGKLVVPANATDYSVNNVSLRRVQDEVAAADIQIPLNITSSSKAPIFVDVRIDANNWHWFALPYDCNIADVTWADGSKAIYNADWFLMYYDGESRSNQKSNYESHWKVYEGTTLEAGKGYIVGITGHPTKSKVKYELRFPMAQEVLTKEQENKTVAVNAWGVKKDIRPNHKGWNLVGNPYMDYYNTASSYSLGGLPLIEYADTYDPSTGLWDYEERESGSVPFLVIPQDGGWSEYKQELASGVDMQPFTAYFVQVGDPNNEGHSNGMKLDARFETTKRGRSSLIRRAPSEVDELEEPAIVAISLTNAKGESDKTTLLIADRFTNEYEMNADFFKWFGDYYTYYTKPVLYTIGADNESRAFNALNEELAAQPVALGMYAAQTGNYTFSLHQRSNLTGVAEVWLHDASNNTHTNLLQDDYTFSTSKTNGAGRFSLSVKMMPKLPTDVENIKQGNVWATTQDNNIVVNGLTKDMQLWIYDATGKLLHADRTTNYQHSYSVPQTGAYFVRVHDKNDAQTIKVVVE